MSLDLSKLNNIFFVGIGGIGISAIARMLLLQGKQVSGSDISTNSITKELEKLGARIISGQGLELVPRDANLIVYSIAIPKYDPEFFKKLQNLGISLLSYPEMLGKVTEDKYTIAVAGTHGKTTTTAMIAKVLIDAGLDPSVVVGSILTEYKSNFIAGQSEFFVVEACEYERSFLNLKPKILVITNIEADHLDYYKDLADIESAFAALRAQSGQVVEDYSRYLAQVPELAVPGKHNRHNAAVALAVADILKIPEEIAQKSLANFSGTARRLEKLGQTSAGVVVYDDYAHHPTEIRASIQALREIYPTSKLTILFQPHLYSRTKALFDDFAKSFGGADEVFLLPIYFAREAPDPEVSSDKLARAIAQNGQKAAAFPDFASAEAHIRALGLGKGEVLITMGAGVAYKIAQNILTE